VERRGKAAGCVCGYLAIQPCSASQIITGGDHIVIVEIFPLVIEHRINVVPSECCHRSAAIFAENPNCKRRVATAISNNGGL
jgi:hypothetical protein